MERTATIEFRNPHPALPLRHDHPQGEARTEHFERDVLCHVNAAYNLARWLLGNDHDAEDAVQEACFRAFRSFRGYQGGDSKAWFLAIVRNTSMNVIRSRNRRERIETDDEPTLMNVHDKSPRPDQAFIAAFNAQALQRAIEGLP